MCTWPRKVNVKFHPHYLVEQVVARKPYEHMRQCLRHNQHTYGKSILDVGMKACWVLLLLLLNSFGSISCPHQHTACQWQTETIFLLLNSRDLRRSKPQSSLLFNALFNLHKFLGFENRDPFALRAEQGEFAGLSDWDKFAKIEYYRWASCLGIDR